MTQDAEDLHTTATDGRDDGWDDTAALEGEAADELQRLRASFGLAPAARQRTIDERYAIVRRHAAGGMGEVYLAHDTRLDRLVALKLVRARPFLDDDRLRERIEREAKALAKLDTSDHVVRVYDVGRHRGRLYFTMPYVEGPNLREWQDADHRGVDALLDLYLQAARGLASAHALGIVHRDFKPANVLIRASDMRAMVADFGIAEALSELDRGRGRETGESSESSEVLELDDGRLTATGALLGTLPYVAPERIPTPDQPSPRAGPASDQFAWCVALWEALAGQPPFAARSLAQLESAVTREPSGGDEVPRWLSAILRRGLAHEPGSRHRDMLALIDAIERARRRRRRRERVVPIALLVVPTLALAARVSNLAPPSLDEGSSACTTLIGEAREVWGPTQRHTLDAMPTIVAQLDSQIATWTDCVEQSCVAGQPAEPERFACLERWLASVEQHVDLLATAPDLERAQVLVSRLAPPDADYCAIGPSLAIDPAVWVTSDAAIAAAMIGADDEARALADRALALAKARAGERRHTPDLAEAHAARAEVLARARDYAAALPEFERAESHAIATGSLARDLTLRALWAKVRVRVDVEQVAVALDDLQRARNLLPALSGHERERVEGELDDAQGLVEYQRDGYAEAAILHRRAATHFELAGRPELAAKALSNLANALQMQDDAEHEALATYEQARALLIAAGLPEGHATRLDVDLNQAQLLVQLDRSEAWAHLDRVARHGNPRRRMIALDHATRLALNLDDAARLADYAPDLLDALAGALAPERVRFEAHHTAATALTMLDDPRGDELFAALWAASAEPTRELEFRRSQIRALDARGRCDAFAAALRAHDEFAAGHELAELDDPNWQADLAELSCPRPS